MNPSPTLLRAFQALAGNEKTAIMLLATCMVYGLVLTNKLPVADFMKFFEYAIPAWLVSHSLEASAEKGKSTTTVINNPPST